MSKAYKALVFAAAVILQAEGPMLRFTAVSANVAGAPDSIRIDLMRWSTDAERDRLLAAWNMTGPPGGGSTGGRAPARGARPAAPAPVPDPTAEDAEAPIPPARPARGRVEGAPPATPEGSLAAAVKQATTVGYLWSSEVAGYAIRYAAKSTGPDGLERIILITDRRLGAVNDLWTPTGAVSAPSYGFSMIELRVNAKGDGEGKASMTGKIVVDNAAKSFGLENYTVAPVIFKDVKRKAG
jgi:hypothetical protein